MIRKEVIPDLSTKIINLCLKNNENGICDNMNFSYEETHEETEEQNNIIKLFDNNTLPITLRKLLLYRQYSYG